MSIDYAQKLADDIRAATRIVAFTGAGMSQESGIAVYRNDATGLWENVNPEELASIDAWMKDPEPMWAFTMLRAATAQASQPNAGHHALAKLGQLPGKEVAVVTQNIDNLHERASLGEEIVHLHGSLFSYRCTFCDTPPKDPEIPTSVTVSRLTPPACEDCGGPIRPTVVWFGEALYPECMNRAEELMVTADLVIIVGTSGVVYPAAALPHFALRAGAKLVEISPADTAFTPNVDYSWRTTAAQGLAAVEALLCPPTS